MKMESVEIYGGFAEMLLSVLNIDESSCSLNREGEVFVRGKKVGTLPYLPHIEESESSLACTWFKSSSLTKEENERLNMNYSWNGGSSYSKKANMFDRELSDREKISIVAFFKLETGFFPKVDTTHTKVSIKTKRKYLPDWENNLTYQRVISKAK